MRKFTTLFLAGFFIISGFCASAQVFVPKDALSVKTSTPPVIDGVIDAIWPDTAMYEINMQRSGEKVDDNDFSAYWSVLWDDDSLYLLVHITDDTLYNEAANAWENDNIEIFFNVTNSIDLKANDGPRYDANKQQFRIIWDSDVQGGTNDDWTNVVFETAAAGDTGYIMEIAFPWSSILTTMPAGGDYFGFDIAINDADVPTAGGLWTWCSPGDYTSLWSDMDKAGVMVFSDGSEIVTDYSGLTALITECTDLITSDPRSQEKINALQEVIDASQALVDAGDTSQVAIDVHVIALTGAKEEYLVPEMVIGEFSDIEFYGDAANYTELQPDLWDLVDEDGDMKYGIIQEKAYGGNRKSLINEKTFKKDYFIEADMKLFKRPDGLEGETRYEDGGFFLSYLNDTNYIVANFSIQHAPGSVDGDGIPIAPQKNAADATGFSGFHFVIDGVPYRVTKRDEPGDPIEEIAPETCLPYEGDTSFADYNKIRVEREGTIVSMMVNGETYFAVDFDTLTIASRYNSWMFDTLEVLPQGGFDMILGDANLGLNSGNDKVYWDNVSAGHMPVEGVFSDIPVLGDAANYTEANPWLWDIIDDNDETVYAIIEDKPAGGNRTSILNDLSYGHDFYVSSDIKLFKRPSGVANTAWWEDAILYFLYQDDKNYAKAEFFNTHGPAESRLSGFTVVVDGTGYVLKKGDAPEDAVEEIPAESCLPYENDESFNDWNNIKVMREGTILSMVVNGEVYFAMDIDTLTVYQSGVAFEAIPQAAIDFLNGSGQVGIGTGNDRVHFDNVMAGAVSSDVTVSDIAFKASTIDGFTAGALENQYTVTIAVADTAYVGDSLVIVPNEASSVVDIISITSDIQETSGTYTIEFKVVSTSGDEASSSIVFDFTLVGIEEFSALGYKIYPNPVQDILRIENIEDVSRIEVFGLTGQKLITVETNGRNSIELNTSTLESGVYLVKAYSGQNMISIAKVLKK